MPCCYASAVSHCRPQTTTHDRVRGGLPRLPGSLGCPTTCLPTPPCPWSSSADIVRVREPSDTCCRRAQPLERWSSSLTAPPLTHGARPHVVTDMQRPPAAEERRCDQQTPGSLETRDKPSGFCSPASAADGGMASRLGEVYKVCWSTSGSVRKGDRLLHGRQGVSYVDQPRPAPGRAGHPATTPLLPFSPSTPNFAATPRPGAFMAGELRP